MKKKRLVLLLALMLSVTACGDESDTSNTNGPTTVESQGESVVDEGNEATQEADEPDVEVKVSVAENFTYTEENGVITITGYEGDATVLEIPESINGMPVVAIGESAFVDNKNIVEVTLPDSVTTVGLAAFQRCYNLEKVTLGNNTEVIGGMAFEGTGVKTINFPDTLHTIGDAAFCLSALEKVEIPPLVTEISSGSFCGTKIETLVIPSSVIRIENEAFEICPNLKEVVIEEGVEFIDDDAFGDCDSLVSITLPSTLTEETDIMAFWGAGSVENVLTIYVPADCVLKDAILELYNDGYEWCGAEVIE